MPSPREHADRPPLRNGDIAYAETIPGALHETHARPVPGAAAGDAITVLQRLIERGGHQIEPRFEVRGLAGEGGMGVVYLARQVALDRDVTLKRLRPDARSDQATAELLQEAWITGALEHPGVVPVYDLGVDRDGNPVIVFKRIGGVTWTALLDRANEVERRFGARDLLEWNLRVLMQVIHAVRFAHSRGIVHRDLKPDNVMIGEFGETYVLDWGIAVSLRDRGGRRPLAARADHLAGTPGYMAPEMLGGAERAISERTDIYLLGAILYQILTGAPPHQGRTLRELLGSATAAEPPVPDQAPPGLVRICHKAMAADPAHRYDSAEAMLRALQDFLQHRGSAELARQAEARAVEIQRLLRIGPERDPEARIGHRQQLYELYGACRFGFLEALSAWSDNQAARGGLRAATEAMIEHELTHGAPHAAAALEADVARVVAVSPALRARMDAALRERARADERRAELERLGRELDIRVGSRTRAIVVLLMGISWVVVPLVSAVVRDITPGFPSNARMAVWSLIMAAMFALLVYVGREQLWQSLINRRLLTMMVVMLLGQGALHLGAELAGVPPVTAQTVQFFYWCGVATVVSFTAEPRLFPTALAYLAGYLVVARLPALRFYVMAAANIVFLTNALVIWLPRGQEPARPALPRRPP